MWPAIASLQFLPLLRGQEAAPRQSTNPGRVLLGNTRAAVVRVQKVGAVVQRRFFGSYPQRLRAAIAGSHSNNARLCSKQASEEAKEEGICIPLFPPNFLFLIFPNSAPILRFCVAEKQTT